MDKVVMLKLGLPVKLVSFLHRLFSSHHVGSCSKIPAIFEMFLDWESARFTKPDKPLTAVQTAMKYYPKYVPIMEIIETKYEKELRTFRWIK